MKKFAAVFALAATVLVAFAFASYGDPLGGEGSLAYGYGYGWGHHHCGYGPGWQRG
jgi:hypothetical protein